MPDRIPSPRKPRTPSPLKSVQLARRATQSPSAFFVAGVEPKIADMLSDPIVAMVMSRDRVSADEVMSMMRRAAAFVD